MLEEKGLKTKKVSLKILAPLLEDCSLEEELTLQDKWAKLLANTVKENSSINSTLYSNILSQLSTLDAEVFNIVFKHCTQGDYNGGKGVIFFASNTAIHKKSFDNGKNAESIDNLIRLRLIKEIGAGFEALTLSDLGFRFMLACSYV